MKSILRNCSFRHSVFRRTLYSSDVVCVCRWGTRTTRTWTSL